MSFSQADRFEWHLTNQLSKWLGAIPVLMPIFRRLKVKEIVDRYFDGQLLIIPGEEINKGSLHVVLLYLPGGLTFRFAVHPGYPKADDFSTEIDDSIHGIELRNPMHDHEMDQAVIRKVARKHNLLLLQNSDAHSLSDIGKYYNEITIEELCARAG